MEYEQALQQLAAFPGRSEGLQKVYRFVGDPENPLFPVFFYRNHIEEHNKSVRFLVDDVADVVESVYPSYNPNLAGLIAITHDDPEMLIFKGRVNDVQLGQAVNMSAQELLEKERMEEERVRKMGERYPYTLGGYQYVWLLQRALKKDCLEAEVVSIMDKNVGWCETRKEIEAGNASVLIPSTPDPKVEPPGLLYPKMINTKMLEKFPRLQRLRETGHPLFAEVPSRDYEEIAKNGRPVTRESILVPTGDRIYDQFNQIHVARLTPEELTRFVTQRESFPADVISTTRLVTAAA